MDTPLQKPDRARRGSPSQLLRALLVLNRRRLRRAGRGLLQRWPAPVSAGAPSYDGVVHVDITPGATASG